MVSRRQLLELIQPGNDNYFARLYNYIMLIAIVIGIIPLTFRSQNTLFTYFDIFSGLCFIIDYLIRWITYDYRSSQKKWVSFVIYPFTPMAIIDMLSILPIINIIAPTFKIARVSRLLKIIRVIKFVRYFQPLIVILNVIYKQRKILYTVLSLAVMYIFITAIIMFNAEEDINPETGTYLFNSFFDAFYWATCTLTTVGYGDLYPISDVGRVISIISSMVGIAIIALPSGIITAGYLDEIRKKDVLKEGESCDLE